MTSSLPATIRDEEQLENLLSEPTDAVVETLGRLSGDVMLLGVGGKMGPTLARMVRRASERAGVSRRVIGVARFSKPELQGRLGAWGIETIRCDLLSGKQLAELPDAANVIYLAAMKFGATGQEARTWAMNVYLPGMVCQRFRNSRIVALSTGNIYPLVRPESGGSKESDPPEPVGDYGMSCLGRERIVTYFSQSLGTRAALIRLNYANDLRYGVLVDVAEKVLAGEPVDLGMAYFNAIWQGDASAMTLRSFEHLATPPAVFNVAGPEVLRVRDLAEQFARRFGKRVQFTGREAPDALLSNAHASYEKLGIFP